MLKSSDLQNIILRLDSSFDSFFEQKLEHRKIKHKEVLKLLSQLRHYPQFIIKQLGLSVEGREIFSVTVGTGKTNILLWSQMHGDEPTSTQAFFDVFNFFALDNTMNEIKDKILGNLTITFVPMLNPDGSERFVRVNGLDIDLNRDASKLVSPESIILHSLLRSLQPDYSFNMHDQDFLWSVGDSEKVAALSFLSPPFDCMNSINSSREKAINLVSYLFNIFNPLVDGRTTRYSDDYEPNAFGETAASMDISTILIEAGIWKNDPDKKYLRKIVYMIILVSLLCIAEDTIPTDKDTYLAMPLNLNKLLTYN